MAKKIVIKDIAGAEEPTVKDIVLEPTVVVDNRNVPRSVAENKGIII